MELSPSSNELSASNRVRWTFFGIGPRNFWLSASNRWTLRHLAAQEFQAPVAAKFLASCFGMDQASKHWTSRSETFASFRDGFWRFIGPTNFREHLSEIHRTFGITDFNPSHLGRHPIRSCAPRAAPVYDPSHLGHRQLLSFVPPASPSWRSFVLPASEQRSFMPQASYQRSSMPWASYWDPLRIRHWAWSIAALASVGRSFILQTRCNYNHFPDDSDVQVNFYKRPLQNYCMLSTVARSSGSNLNFSVATSKQLTLVCRCFPTRNCYRRMTRSNNLTANSMPNFTLPKVGILMISFFRNIELILCETCMYLTFLVWWIAVTFFLVIIHKSYCLTVLFGGAKRRKNCRD